MLKFCVQITGSHVFRISSPTLLLLFHWGFENHYSFQRDLNRKQRVVIFQNGGRLYFFSQVYRGCSNTVGNALLENRYFFPLNFSPFCSKSFVSRNNGSWEHRESSSQLIASGHCSSVKTNIVILLQYTDYILDDGNLKRSTENTGVGTDAGMLESVVVEKKIAE